MEDFSLFDCAEATENQPSMSCSSRLDVVKIDYIGCESMLPA